MPIAQHLLLSLLRFSHSTIYINWIQLKPYKLWTQNNVQFLKETCHVGADTGVAMVVVEQQMHYLHQSRVVEIAVDSTKHLIKTTKEICLFSFATQKQINWKILKCIKREILVHFGVEFVLICPFVRTKAPRTQIASWMLTNKNQKQNKKCHGHGFVQNMKY